MTGWKCVDCVKDPWRMFPNGTCVKCNELNQSAPPEPVMRMSTGIKKGLDRRRRKHTDATLARRIQEAQDKIEKIIDNYCNCVSNNDPCTACKILDELRRKGE